MTRFIVLAGLLLSLQAHAWGQATEVTQRHTKTRDEVLEEAIRDLRDRMTTLELRINGLVRQNETLENQVDLMEDRLTAVE